MKYPVRFGKYLLLERVNVGGMAEVFKAKQFGVEGFQRIIAVKRILPNMSEDVEFINMFVDEARLAVQLNHANIVQIYELDKVTSQYYIAMEYVAGKDLRRIIEGFRKRKQVMPVPLAAYICAKVCEGLDYAHRRHDPSGKPMNLVHRDVSPQNILVSFDGDVKVIDFGIAKAADRLSKTQAGVLKGKFGYMSPEQVSGSDIDHRSDLFAVGVLLWEMLTCQRLFVAETDFSTLEKVRQCDIPAMKTHNAEIPEELEEIVRKALAKDLSERYEWCSDFSEALQQFLITDHSIFNSKRMAQFMKETFHEDIETERSKQQEFSRITIEDVAETADNSSDGQGAAPGESTAIFDGSDQALASAKTHFGEAPSAGGTNSSGWKNTNSGNKKPNADLLATRSLDDEVKQLNRSGPLREPSQRSQPINRTTRVPEIIEERDNTKWILGGAVLAALLIVGGAVFWTQRGRGGGTGASSGAEDGTLVRLQVNPPIVQGEFYVDQKMVQKGLTPFDPMKLPTGKHEVKFVAKDYDDWTRNVEFKGETTNILQVTLAAKAVPVPTPSAPPAPTGPAVPPQPSAATGPAVPPQPVARKATIDFDSNPPGSTIYLDGQSFGVTPKKIELEIGRKLKVELRRAGYKTEQQEMSVVGDERFSPTLKKELGGIVSSNNGGGSGGGNGGSTGGISKSNGGGSNGGSNGGNGGGNGGNTGGSSGGAKPSSKDTGAIAVIVKNAPDTKIVIDGRDTKRVTPVLPGDPLKLAPGKHMLTFVFSDGTKKTIQIDINKNETQKIIETK